MFGIAAQMVGELPMNVLVIENAKRIREALAVWLTGGAWRTQSSFADDRSTIAGLLEGHADRD